MPPPNKRLKLPGAGRLRGTGVLCPGRHRVSFIIGALGAGVARSLSAVR